MTRHEPLAVKAQTAAAMLEPLMPLTVPAIAEGVRASGAPMPEHLIGGFLGRMQFVVTLDSDGQLECSLSCPDGRPTEGQIAAFYRMWGMPLPEAKATRINGGRGLHWVLRGGVQH